MFRFLGSVVTSFPSEQEVPIRIPALPFDASLVGIIVRTGCFEFILCFVLSSEEVLALYWWQVGEVPPILSVFLYVIHRVLLNPVIAITSIKGSLKKKTYYLWTDSSRNNLQNSNNLSIKANMYGTFYWSFYIMPYIFDFTLKENKYYSFSESN